LKYGKTGRARNCLIVCPKSVLTDWERKLWEWAPELNRVLKIAGPQSQRRMQWNTDAYVYIVTYDTLRHDLSDSDYSQSRIQQRGFDLIILDEIQRIKNPGAKLTKAVHMVSAPIRWGLSGTPLENRIEDVLSIFAYIKPGSSGFSVLRIPSITSRTFVLDDLVNAVHELEPAA